MWDYLRDYLRDPGSQSQWSKSRQTNSRQTNRRQTNNHVQDLAKDINEYVKDPQDLAIMLSDITRGVPQIRSALYSQLAHLDPNIVRMLLPPDIIRRTQIMQYAAVTLLTIVPPVRLQRLSALMEAMRGMQPEKLKEVEDAHVWPMGSAKKAVAAIVWDAAASAQTAAGPPPPSGSPASYFVNGVMAPFVAAAAAAASAADLVPSLTQLVAQGKLATVACMKLFGHMYFAEAALEAAFTADNEDAYAAVNMHKVSTDAYINKHDPGKRWADDVRKALKLRLPTLSSQEKSAYIEDLVSMGLLETADVPGVRMVRLLKSAAGDRRQEMLDVYRQGMDYYAFMQVTAWHADA